jgi:hypothetical protein
MLNLVGSKSLLEDGYLLSCKVSLIELDTHNFQLHADDDKITWKFGKQGKFTVKSLYSALTKNDAG